MIKKKINSTSTGDYIVYTISAFLIWYFGDLLTLLEMLKEEYWLYGVFVVVIGLMLYYVGKQPIHICDNKCICKFTKK